MTKNDKKMTKKDKKSQKISKNDHNTKMKKSYKNDKK